MHIEILSRVSLLLKVTRQMWFWQKGEKGKKKEKEKTEREQGRV